jgi:hypothetical protein
MPSEWDKYKSDDNGKFVKFKTPGDFIEGIVTKVSFELKFGEQRPVLYLNCNGEERILTVGQKNLQRKLAENPPQAGDGILITFTGEQTSNQGNPLKLFEVKITPKALTGSEAPQSPAEPESDDEPF